MAAATSGDQTDERPWAASADPRFAPSPVDAVVFDLGNVLIRWDPVAAVAGGVGLDRARAFLTDDEFDFAGWNRQQDAGRGWAEAEAAAVRSHPQWADAVRAYREHFPRSLTGAVDDTVAILRELHAQQVPLFALTNWSRELFPAALERFEFLDLFEDIVVSGEEGTAKPDPEIFAVLEARIRHRGSLDDAVFIDDNPDNVQAAQAAGMDAILFTDTGHLREDLRARGLPLRPA